MGPRSRAWLGVVGEPVLAFILAGSIRLAGLSKHVPNADDMLHFYAARSYLHHGAFSILSGTYTRAKDFTLLVAGSMAIFGDSLTAARVPSVVCGSLLVAGVYVWLRKEAGRGPAFIAAGLLALMAPAIILSVLVRFYALQGMLFWVGVMLLYRITVGGRPTLATGLLGALAAAALAEAVRLQIVTMIGLAGFSVWAVLYLTWRARQVFAMRTLVSAWALLAVLGGAVLLASLASGDALRLWQTYRFAEWWALPTRNDALFYIKVMTRDIGLLFGMLPLLTLVAVTWRPRATLYCATVLLVALIAHSFGGMKEQRYVGYLLPYIACLWGLGAWPIVMFLRDRLIRFAGWRAAGRPGSALAVICVCGAGAAGLIQGVPALQQFPLSLTAGYRWPNEKWDWGWPNNREKLRALARDADVFIVDDDLMADHYVGRADLVLNKSRMLENKPPAEFVPDFRTGTPTISSDASLRAVMSCFERGVIVVHPLWSFDWMPQSTLSFVSEHARSLGPMGQLVGFAWNSPQGASAADCDRLRKLVSTTATERHNAPAPEK